LTVTLKWRFEVVFWIWLSVCVLAFPPIAFGLAIATMYFYLRLVLRVDLQQMLIMRTQTTEKRRSSPKNRWNHWIFFRVPAEMHTGEKDDPELKTCTTDNRLIVKVGGLFIGLVCFAKCINSLLW
jgi:hypothetical protein